ncbi:hypothetical protein L1987_29790 [Smallanthus sonchifolius]|uniref:Uncharacterized protein n=1 Tax=Smallanthus sonchifolius TaxID=185202 RepID=A0ACB9I258_9ASTR|nr:hypothetical protein L1987_29790 [Smallanthus sonchifolius]
MICSSSYHLLQQPSSSSFSNNRHSATPIRWGFTRGIDSSPGMYRTKVQVATANANVTVASGKAKKEVIMVDPAEAKRLAAKQMEAIKKKQTFKRRRQIEAINGAWAMLGLTASLVIEGQTGNGILAQFAGYWAVVVNFFVR